MSIIKKRAEIIGEEYRRGNIEIATEKALNVIASYPYGWQRHAFLNNFLKEVNTK